MGLQDEKKVKKNAFSSCLAKVIVVASMLVPSPGQFPFPFPIYLDRKFILLGVFGENSWSQTLILCLPGPARINRLYALMTTA